MSHANDVSSLLKTLGVNADIASSAPASIDVHSPIDGSRIARIAVTSPAELDAALNRAHRRFLSWRDVPAPKRGELVRAFGETVRRHKTELGQLITLETGKMLQEGLGEVQEVIDICEFAVGLSRQLYGLTIASERPDHKLLETWHPIGVVGIISAFNFPMAVFAWNAALALVCGNTLAWKPSEKTPLSAIALNGLLLRTAKELGLDPDGLSELLGGPERQGKGHGLSSLRWTTTEAVPYCALAREETCREEASCPYQPLRRAAGHVIFHDLPGVGRRHLAGDGHGAGHVRHLDGVVDDLLGDRLPHHVFHDAGRSPRPELRDREGLVLPDRRPPPRS